MEIPPQLWMTKTFAIHGDVKKRYIFEVCEKQRNRSRVRVSVVKWCLASIVFVIYADFDSTVQIVVKLRSRKVNVLMPQ